MDVREEVLREQTRNHLEGIRTEVEKIAHSLGLIEEASHGYTYDVVSTRLDDRNQMVGHLNDLAQKGYRLVYFNAIPAGQSQLEKHHALLVAVVEKRSF